MCDQQTFQKLQQTVEQFLETNQMFTGYDVTIETRSREKINLRHTDVRGDIHNIQALNDALDFGYQDKSGNTISWKKSQISVPTGGWAFLYHPSNMDPSGYQPRFQNQTAPKSIQSISSIDKVVSDSGGQKDDGKFESVYRDRLLVPTRFIRDAGLHSGDMANIIVDINKNQIFITTSIGLSILNATGFSTQKVEKDGDIRLSSKTIRSANMDTSEKFSIEISINTSSDGTPVTGVCVKNA